MTRTRKQDASNQDKINRVEFGITAKRHTSILYMFLTLIFKVHRDFSPASDAMYHCGDLCTINFCSLNKILLYKRGVRKPLCLLVFPSVPFGCLLDKFILTLKFSLFYKRFRRFVLFLNKSHESNL